MASKIPSNLSHLVIFSTSWNPWCLNMDTYFSDGHSRVLLRYSKL